MSAAQDIPLTTDLLRLAYSRGFFPMGDPENNEILWLNPDTRAIIPLDEFHCSKSLKKTIRKNIFKMTINQAFQTVMEMCANRKETWITKEFIKIYTQLHQEGNAHSIEIWKNSLLVGGLYGVSLGGAFFAESKFHRERDASKVALFYLVDILKKGGFVLLEVQFLTDHLRSLGAKEISRKMYQALLETALKKKTNIIL